MSDNRSPADIRNEAVARKQEELAVRALAGQVEPWNFTIDELCPFFKVIKEIPIEQGENYVIKGWTVTAFATAAWWSKGLILLSLDPNAVNLANLAGDYTRGQTPFRLIFHGETGLFLQHSYTETPGFFLPSGKTLYLIAACDANDPTHLLGDVTLDVEKVVFS